MSVKETINTVKIGLNIYDVLGLNFKEQLKNQEEKFLDHLKFYYPQLQTMYPDDYPIEDVGGEYQERHTREIKEDSNALRILIAEHVLTQIDIETFITVYNQKFTPSTLEIDYLRALPQSLLEVRFFYGLEDDAENQIHAETLDGKDDKSVFISEDHHIEFIGDDEFLSRIITLNDQHYLSGCSHYIDDECFSVLEQQGVNTKESYMISALIRSIQLFVLKDGEGSADDDFRGLGQFKWEVYYSLDQRIKILNYFKEKFQFHKNKDSGKKHDYYAHDFIENKFVELNFTFSISKVTIASRYQDVLEKMFKDHNSFLDNHAKRSLISGRTMREMLMSIRGEGDSTVKRINLDGFIEYDEAA